jgi:hypothetical protein
MATIACSQCGKEFDDGVLCCPHCGAAQIPQLSKAQLRLEQMKASHGPMAGIYLGMLLGLLAGGVYFGITVWLNRASLASGMAILLGGMIGSAAGFFYHHAFQRDRR